MKKTYYTTDKDGKITQSANWKFADDALETEKEIVRGRDGQLYFAGEEPQITLEELKQSKLAEISAAYAQYDATGTVMTSQGFPVQIGQSHCTKLDGAIRFAEMIGQPVIYITDADNVTHHDIPLETAKLVLIQQMAAALAAHQLKQELRAAVEAAETAEELEAVEIGF